MWFSISSFVPSCCLIIISLLPIGDQSPIFAAILMIISVSLNSTAYLGPVINIMELCPPYTAVLYGISNSGGTLPGIIGVYLVGLILETQFGWPLVFQLTAAVSICGAAFYIAFAENTRQFE